VEPLNDMTSWVANIIEFWFNHLERKDWFAVNEKVDHIIIDKYANLWQSEHQKQATYFIDDEHNALAAIILFDQFPRNMFRGKAAAFSSDTLAVDIAKLSIDKGLDHKLSMDRRVFLYMPFMHSENMDDQKQSLKLFNALGEVEQMKYALSHYKMIERFGRFPHRNSILGRVNSAEETLSIKQGNSW